MKKTKVTKTAKKAPVKAKVKAAAKAKPAVKLAARPKVAPVAAVPKSVDKTGFMWKLLERKEAELKKREAARDPHAGAYARFGGPRRRGA